MKLNIKDTFNIELPADKILENSHQIGFIQQTCLNMF